MDRWYSLLLAAAVVVLALKAIGYLRIWLAARRMGLRDKGYITPWVSPGNKKMLIRVHGACQTRQRIGIRTLTGDSVHYCWRCECVIKQEDDYESPGPPGGHREPRLKSGEVISLADHKKAS